MHALTEAAIRRSMVNCSRSEAAALTPPRDLAELDWASLDVLGWRDWKAELRGYLVHERDGEPITEALSAFGEDLLEHPDWYGSHDDQTVEQLRALVADDRDEATERTTADESTELTTADQAEPTAAPDEVPR